MSGNYIESAGFPYLQEAEYTRNKFGSDLLITNQLVGREYNKNNPKKQYKFVAGVKYFINDLEQFDRNIANYAKKIIQDSQGASNYTKNNVKGLNADYNTYLAAVKKDLSAPNPHWGNADRALYNLLHNQSRVAFTEAGIPYFSGLSERIAQELDRNNSKLFSKNEYKTSEALEQKLQSIQGATLTVNNVRQVLEILDDAFGALLNGARGNFVKQLQATLSKVKASDLIFKKKLFQGAVSRASNSEFVYKNVAQWIMTTMNLDSTSLNNLTFVDVEGDTIRQNI